MTPWELLDVAPIPGSQAELSLLRRGSEFSIRVNHEELMNSRVHGSEEALARIACRRIATGRPPHVLIGGLGMGYTLSSALRELESEANVLLVELSPAVVAWNRGPLADLAGRPLEDGRVNVFEGDVAETLRAERVCYDVILLDVDNGPEGLTRGGNDWLYGLSGLAAAFGALRPGGVLAVWSATPDRRFSTRLRRTGFKVDDYRLPARGDCGGPDHTVWLAERPRRHE
jgi:spermidine synthase